MTDLENTLYETLRRVRNGGQSAVEIDSVLRKYEIQSASYEKFLHRQSVHIHSVKMFSVTCYACNWKAGPDTSDRINKLADEHIASI